MFPLLIGIAGGTGSGKTTLAKHIAATFKDRHVCLIDTDSYYLDRSHLPISERHNMNFDHPDAFDIPLLVEHLRNLRQGHSIQKQIYDFATHIRTDKAITVTPEHLVIVEGILIFAIGEVCDLFDLKIFLEEDADIRFSRRIIRDVQERGRTVESVSRQYLKTVRPMHLEYVEPSKNKADIIVKPGSDWQRVIEVIDQLMRERFPNLPH